MYSLVVALEVAWMCGAGERLHSEIDIAAERVEELVATWSPGGSQEDFPKDLARGLHRTVPQIAGSGLTAPIAYRWKTQINENAKRHAFFAELPEADHNEICGWESGAPLSVVFLDDSTLHRRLRRRIELTAEVARGGAKAVECVESVGESAFERLMSLVFLGDLTSVYLAVLDGTDPTPVPVLERFKVELG